MPQDTSAGRQKNHELSAADFVPETRSLKVLADAVQDCRGCPLYRNATQGVFGAGSRTSPMMLVGEQPGDQEDEQGKPFVGPAGQLLNRCLEEAGIARTEVYLTNAVKHFKFEQHGQRRLHQKPSAREMRACRPWLERELELIHPDVLVCLGATAAKALLGPEIRVTTDRGRKLSSEWCSNTLVTFHPSAILRAPDSVKRAEMREQFLSDLMTAARWMRSALSRFT